MNTAQEDEDAVQDRFAVGFKYRNELKFLVLAAYGMFKAILNSSPIVELQVIESIILLILLVGIVLYIADWCGVSK